MDGIKPEPGRYAVIMFWEWSDSYCTTLRLPSGLSLDVLEAWLDRSCQVMAVATDPEYLDQEPGPPNKRMLKPEHAETAMAMLSQP